MRLLSIAICFILMSMPVAAEPGDSLLTIGKRLLSLGTNRGDIEQVYAARATFERASADTLFSLWLPYYVALADYRIANFLLVRGSDFENRASEHLANAVAHLRPSAEGDGPNAAEACALISMVYGRQISISPLKGILLGPKSNRMRKRAEDLAPRNPRVVFSAALNDFHTPRMFGGNKKRALEGFERAASLFTEQVVAESAEPAWGHSETYAWMGIARIDRQEYVLARAAFEKALDIDPDQVWVKRELLPEAMRSGRGKTD